MKTILILALLLVFSFTLRFNPQQHLQDTTEEKPAEKTEQKPAQKTEEKSAQKTEEKSAQKTEEKSAQKTEEKPAQKTEEKPAQKTEEKPAQKTEEKPAQKTEEKPAQKTEEKPAQKTEEKPAQKTEEKPAQKKQTLVGGWSERKVEQLTDDEKKIDQYLRQTFPELKGFKLTKAQTQVVSGMNYRYNYKNEQNNKSIEFTVWDQPWTKTRQVSQVKRVTQSKNDKGQQVRTTKTVIANKGQYNDLIKGLFE